jgi:hypothetical protein
MAMKPDNHRGDNLDSGQDSRMRCMTPICTGIISIIWIDCMCLFTCAGHWKATSVCCARALHCDVCHYPREMNLWVSTSNYRPYLRDTSVDTRPTSFTDVTYDHTIIPTWYYRVRDEICRSPSHFNHVRHWLFAGLIIWCETKERWLLLEKYNIKLVMFGMLQKTTADSENRIQKCWTFYLS